MTSLRRAGLQNGCGEPAEIPGGGSFRVPANGFVTFFSVFVLRYWTWHVCYFLSGSCIVLGWGLALRDFPGLSFPVVLCQCLIV